MLYNALHCTNNRLFRFQFVGLVYERRSLGCYFIGCFVLSLLEETFNLLDSRRFVERGVYHKVAMTGGVDTRRYYRKGCLSQNSNDVGSGGDYYIRGVYTDSGRLLIR